jgi:chromosome segregation protein
MLKRLELVGFKSFAEKTSFEFADGVTGIIGPNGSGKSNVVDAVRWVLGEQSARSLRGGEMTDVIFNGSASRRSLGLAEVSMVFDNSRHVLATDSEEVRITRRVYRSGESEYLINSQPCRLKDIKDLFLGSGAGTNAYCIIQQGQVDVLLQTAPRDRRTIFEEAAGISRFKARKTEALRKLERVANDLTRLHDILDQEEKQLRSLRLQAAKAQRFQEYSDRLKELRIGLSLREFHHLHTQLQSETIALDALRQQLDEETRQSDSCERELATVDECLALLEDEAQRQQAELSRAKEHIAGELAQYQHASSSADQLEIERDQHRERLAALVVQTDRLVASCAEARQLTAEAQAQCQQQRELAQRVEKELADNETRLLQLRQQLQQSKDEQLEQMRQSARLQNEAVGCKAQLDNLTRERSRLLLRSEQAAEHLASLDVELEELTAAEESLQGRLSEVRAQQAELRGQQQRLLDNRDEAIEQVSQLRAERSGLVSRIEVLEKLERSHEGLSTGVREVLQELQRGEPGPWSSVVGIVAELLTVRREFAALIDLALGDRAQRFVVRDLEQLAEALRRRGQSFSGRVSFLPLRPVPAVATSAGSTQVVGKATGRLLHGLSLHPGVVALAEQVVRCEDPAFADLPALLLQNTLIVRDLTAARAIASLGAGFRCITLAGELLEADGTLTVGTHHAEAGILSRKSELRELRNELIQLDERLADMEAQIEQYRRQLSMLEPQLEQLGNSLDVLTEQLTDMRWRIGQHQQRRQGLTEEVSLSQTEISQLDEDIDRLHSTWQEKLEQVAQAEATVTALREGLEALEAESRQREAARERLQQAQLTAATALAQQEERLASLRQRQEKLEAEVAANRADQQRRTERLRSLDQRLEQTHLQLLALNNSLADWFARKEQAARQLVERHLEQNALIRRRQELIEQMQPRTAWRQQQEQLHARQLAVNDKLHLRQALCDRLREDYQLELSSLYEELVASDRLASLEEPLSPPVEGEPIPPDQEIIELRRKLSKLGSVNLEAIAELEEADNRYNALRVQYDDLMASRKKLEDIIDVINTESRRLFTEVFETIRTHFQELFRKLFGGGQADIVLEEGDILEAGIEVVARPPGKELRSISLLSGGEKTMTAVALLLAIFRSKPSPFCILDEVDAALDEANVGRFTAVLREFLNLSQFIVITHHKRTMAAADVLYGVTMQESGVSTRFSVRFEDWPDEEPKSQAASGR